MDRNQSGSDDSGVVTKARKTKSSETKTRSSKSKSMSMSSKDTPTSRKYSLEFEADRILGASLIDGRIVFRIKEKDSHRWEEVPAIVANKVCPELVISFYEAHIVLEGEYLY